jgi:hypothetical protein
MRNAGIFLLFGLLLTVVPSFAEPSICNALAGNLVLNCGFELPYAGDGNVPTDWNGSQFTGFEDVVDDPVNSGLQSMRIANDEFQSGEPLFNGAAIMSQSFTDTPGQTYTFDFYLYNADPNGPEEQFQAFWGPSSNPTSVTPLFVDTGSAPESWVLESFVVTGTGSDTITFTSYNTPSYYYLDDVSLVSNAVSTVPEPSTLIPTMVGLIVVLFSARQATKRSARREPLSAK